MNNPPEEEESLMLKRFLVKIKKKEHEPTQRNSLFRTKFKSQGKCSKMIINSCITDNLVSTEMVEKLGLKRMKDPTPYNLGCRKDINSW